MIPWLLQHLTSFAEWLQSHTSGDSRVLLSARAGGAALGAFLLTLLSGPTMIRWLRGRAGERIDSASARLNELHAGKQNTPTMGGLLILLALLTNILVWADLTNHFVQLSLATAVSFAALGLADDWIKLQPGRRGLRARQKFAAQWVLALLLGGWLYFELSQSPSGLSLPLWFGAGSIGLGLFLIPWSALVLVGSSNGVNLTDGLDGLATGCAVFTAAAFVAVSYLAGHAGLAAAAGLPFFPACGEICVVAAALTGALLGFLWFNCHPAKVFMGDTGSLPLGALLGLIALVCRQELLLAVVGGVFVTETLSVIVQVSYYRLTGKKLILCSPLHNHFVFRGDPETRIVTRFWISSALLTILGGVLLKLR